MNLSILSDPQLLHRPRPAKSRHGRMSPQQRAAQFAPFAALSGYEERVAEATRDSQQELRDTAPTDWGA